MTVTVQIELWAKSEDANYLSIYQEYNFHLEKLIANNLQYFGHLMRRANSVEKTDAGKDRGQEEKGPTEDEMVGWHHRLNGQEFEQTPEIVKDKEACCAAVHGVAKSQT